MTPTYRSGNMLVNYQHQVQERQRTPNENGYFIPLVRINSWITVSLYRTAMLQFHTANSFNTLYLGVFAHET